MAHGIEILSLSLTLNICSIVRHDIAKNNESQDKTIEDDSRITHERLNEIIIHETLSKLTLGYLLVFVVVKRK